MAITITAWELDDSGKGEQELQTKAVKRVAEIPALAIWMRAQYPTCVRITKQRSDPSYPIVHDVWIKSGYNPDF